MEYVKPVLQITLTVACISRSVALFVPETITLVVGQPFRYAFEAASGIVNVQDASGEELPAWLIWRNRERILEGVPQPADIGKTFLRVTNDQDVDVIEISISEEIRNPCGFESSTLWLEIAFNTSLNNFSITDQLQLVNNISSYFNVSSSVLRVYSNKYKEDIRRAEIIQSGMEHEPNDNSVTIMWKLSCDEVDDEVINVLERVLAFVESDAVAHNLIGWRLKKGILLPRRQRNHIAGTDVMSQLSGFATNEPYVHYESTVPSKTTTRSTRSTKKSDHAPVRLNSLQAFKCIRGKLCEYTIPRETFMDAEDGDTRALTLSVFPIVADKNWLTLEKNEQILRGISLHSGDFEFRLEARDSSNQMTSAPFRVTVLDAPTTNHLFILDVEHSSERLTKDPDTLYAFAKKLANSLGDRFPRNLIIRNIEAVDGVRPQSRITFSNATLSHKFCQKKAIDAIKYLMLTRKRDRIRTDFVHSMDNRFRVRNAKLELLGNCAEKLPTSRPPMDIVVSTTAHPPGYDSSPAYLWLPVAVIAFLIFFFATLILICCLIKRKKTKGVQSEYISKGLPVVFPEEIPQEDESATVSTPMLVKEERPPLIISQHENPLYKPPPPLSAASSPRPRNAFTNQRQPPPYVPP